MPGVCRVVPMPDSPENKCPTCFGSGRRYDRAERRVVDCYACGGSGRINTSSPPPDRETGELVIEEHVPCEGDCEFCEETARAGEDYQYEFDSTAGFVAWLNGTLDASSGVFRWVPDSVEGGRAPSAATTDSDVKTNRVEGEN